MLLQCSGPGPGPGSCSTGAADILGSRHDAGGTPPDEGTEGPALVGIPQRPAGEGIAAPGPAAGGGRQSPRCLPGGGRGRHDGLGLGLGSRPAPRRRRCCGAIPPGVRASSAQPLQLDLRPELLRPAALAPVLHFGGIDGRPAAAAVAAAAAAAGSSIATRTRGPHLLLQLAQSSGRPLPLEAEPLLLLGLPGGSALPGQPGHGIGLTRHRLGGGIIRLLRIRRPWTRGGRSGGGVGLQILRHDLLPLPPPLHQFSLALLGQPQPRLPPLLLCLLLLLLPLRLPFGRPLLQLPLLLALLHGAPGVDLPLLGAGVRDQPRLGRRGGEEGVVDRRGFRGHHEHWRRGPGPVGAAAAAAGLLGPTCSSSIPSSTSNSSASFRRGRQFGLARQERQAAALGRSPGRQAGDGRRRRRRPGGGRDEEAVQVLAELLLGPAAVAAADAGRDGGRIGHDGPNRHGPAARQGKARQGNVNGSR
mmetsp:Transcript_29454/g.85723  ORF Transcript_29454/g.85723 Transcript_29454/m.85723 type:complete len:474 (-) Transcript_29454:210-1631(-)